MRIKKQKTEKWVAKTIKCIYSEPVILILLSARFDFWANEIFSNSIKPVDNNFVTAKRSKFGIQKWDNLDFGLFFYAIVPAFKLFLEVYLFL